MQSKRQVAHPCALGFPRALSFGYKAIFSSEQRTTVMQAIHLQRNERL